MSSYKPRPDHPLHAGFRAVLTCALLLPALGVLMLGFQQATLSDARPELPCWILSNARVLENPFNSSCPLESSDHIRRVERGGAPTNVERTEDIWSAALDRTGPVRVEVERDGATRWIELPTRITTRETRTTRVAMAAVLTVFLLGIPLLLLWRSDSQAALALAVLYASIATICATALAAQRSELASRIAALSFIPVPAALAHLALTFPRSRPIVQSAPSIQVVPYAAAMLLLPLAFQGLQLDSILWLPYLHLIGAMTVGAWVVLLLSCINATREASSAVERARARLVLFGALLVPLVPTIAFALATDHFSQIGSLYLWLLPMTLPIPIAFAISRYNLFALGTDTRSLIARMLYLGLSALILSIVLALSLTLAGAPAELREPPILFLMSLVAVAALEPVRTSLPGLLSNVLTPQLGAHQRIRTHLAKELATLGDPDSVLQSIANALRDGVSARNGALLLCWHEIWRPAQFFGTGPPERIGLAHDAIAALEERSLIHLPLIEDPNDTVKALESVGIEVVTAFRFGDELLGVALLGPAQRRGVYSSLELDFIETVGALGGIALHNARLSDELISAEDKAAIGRAALGIAHDLGKELGWIHRLAQRLYAAIGDPRRVRRDAKMLSDLTADTVNSLQRFVEDSKHRAASSRMGMQPAVEPLDRLIEQTVRRLENEHGIGRVSVIIESAARRAGCHFNLARALFNLLDNALHASPPGQMVHLFATRAAPGQLRIEIRDQGVGIPPELSSRVFDVNFTTRKKEGGSGIGLTVVREILLGLGGRIELSAQASGGTVATVHLPFRATWR